MQVSFPEKFSNKEGLNVTIGEDIYIVVESTEPRKMVFCREMVDGQEVAYVSKIRQMNITKTKYFYPVFSIPTKIKELNGLKKAMRISDIPGGKLFVRLCE